MNFGFGVLIAVLLLTLPGAVVARAGRLRWPVAIAVGPALTYGVVGLAIVPFGALGIRWNALTALAALVVVTAIVLGLRILLARFRDRGCRGSAGVAVARPDRGRRGGARRARDRLRGLAWAAALAVDPEHLGRGLARQHHPLDPRHRSGLADPHGRAAQRRDARRAVLPVDVPRPRPRCWPS